MKNVLSKLKNKSIIKIINYIWKIPFFYFYKFLFNNCNSIYISGNFQILGKKHIEIGTFSAGSRIRIDAIDSYNNQNFKPTLKIGNNFVVNNDIHIACNNKVIIGNNVLFGSHIYITDHDHGIYDGENCCSPFLNPVLRNLTFNSHVIIEDNVFIGENVTILKDVTIGEGSIIGANSLVSKNVPPFSIAVGNPAKVVKYFDKSKGIWIKIKN